MIEGCVFPHIPNHIIGIMRVSWTFPELFWILLLGFTALAAGFSRFRPVTESWAALLGAHYLVINTTCWNAFLITTSWEGGEDVFRFGIGPFLPATSFYLGIFTVMMIVGALFSTWRSTTLYSGRQKWSFLVSSIVLLVGIFVSLRTPVALQWTIDSWAEHSRRAD